MGDIIFGTDGWRGVIADDFTVSNVQRVAQAITAYAGGLPRDGKLVVGYDNRFMSEYYAKVAAEVVAGNGVHAVVSGRAVTTPMLSQAVKAEGASGGIMITASHNPYFYNGVKFKAGYGGSATKEMAGRIENLVDASPAATMPYEKALAGGLVTERDFFPAYRDQALGTLKADALSGSGIRAVLDCMHGSAGHYASSLWEAVGLDARVIRAARDPYFGGGNPEPVEKNLAALAGEVRDSGADIGVAFDGDADRFAVLDAEGTFVTPHQVFALLLIHLRKNRKLDGLVVKTVSTSTLIDRLAADLGLKVVETPVGFKHISEWMINGDVLIGGEENGGIGFKGYLPERDGMLSALTLIEMMAVEGRGLRELLAGLEKRYGGHHYRRLDLKLTGAMDGRLFEDIRDRSGSVFGEFGVRQVRVFDGVKVSFDDGSWILFRLSGTEPLLRVYCEAADPSRLDMLLSRAKEAFLG